MRRRAGAALALLLAGCAAGPQTEPQKPAATPERIGPARAPDGDASSFVMGGRAGQQKRPVAASLQPDEANQRQAMITHWDTLTKRWAQVRAAIEAGAYPEEPLLEWSLPARYLDVRYVVVRGEAPAPAPGPRQYAERDMITRGAPEVAPEVVIVMEGDRGIIEIEGRPTPVQVGTVCVLPAGARGKMQGAVDTPLQLLIIRAMDKPADAARGVRTPAVRDQPPLVTSFDELWEGPLARAAQAAGPNEALEPVGSLSERIGIYAWHIQGFVPTRLHEERDLFFIALNGDGRFGAASSGHVLKTGSLVFVPAGVTYYYQNFDKIGTRALALVGPGWDPKDVHLVEGPTPQRKGEARTQVEPPGSPKAGPRKPTGSDER